MLRAFCLTLALAGCGERAAPEVDTDVEAEPIARPEPEATPDLPLQEAPPSFRDRDLDAMDEPSLQAACFAGSMAACDRLDIARCDRPLPAEKGLHERDAPAQDALPALDDGELDAMDEPALEAACFNGSTAACDRLGH